MGEYFRFLTDPSLLIGKGEGRDMPSSAMSWKGNRYDGKEAAKLCSAHQRLFGRVGAARSLL
ncbi:MAG: hypothetical protein NVSMB49_22770 [Ktedonobacteraceae bacterium]